MGRASKIMLLGCAAAAPMSIKAVLIDSHPVLQARVAVVEWLKELGLLRGREGNPGMQLAICTRSEDVIEPMLKPQWWVDMKEMAAKAVAAVKEKDPRANPSSPLNPESMRLHGPSECCSH